VSVRVAIAGVSGRMGRALLEAVAADDGCALHAALDRPGSSLVGQDAGAAWGAANGIMVTDQAQAALAGAHVATLPFKVFQQMVRHPLTDSGIVRFREDWEKARRALEEQQPGDERGRVAAEVRKPVA